MHIAMDVFTANMTANPPSGTWPAAFNISFQVAESNLCIS
jgi:hypothetical protein